MATTTNYSWTTPDDTDLVKDGASAIRSLGSAIDSTVFTNAGNALQKSTIDAKGDLLVGTADNTVARLAVGTNNYVLTADSNETSGLKWAAPAGGGGSYIKIVSNTFTSVSSVSLPNDTFTSTYDDYVLIWDITATSGALTIQGRFRASGADDTNTNYFSQLSSAGTSAANIDSVNQTIFTFGYSNSGGTQNNGVYTITNPKLSQKTKVVGGGVALNAAATNINSFSGTHFYNATTSFDSFTLIASANNFSGRYVVYGLEK